MTEETAIPAETAPAAPLASEPPKEPEALPAAPPAPEPEPEPAPKADDEAQPTRNQKRSAP